MAQTKTGVSNSSYELLSFAVSRLSSAAILILLLDYCDVIASLSLGENKMAACRSKMSILLPRVFATNSTTEQIIAIFRYFMV